MMNQFWRIEWEKMPWFTLQCKDGRTWKAVSSFQAPSLRVALILQQEFLAKGGMLKHRSRIKRGRANEHCNRRT